MRTNFRETLWFKKGLLDDGAARQEPAGDSARIASDTLPVEDRYNEDGSLLPSDSWVFGVHSGTTQAVETIRPIEPAGVPEQALVAELKTGRRMIFAMLAGAALAIGSLVMTLV